MNLTTRTFYCISSLKDMWKSFVQQNSELTPFQDYFYNECIFRHRILEFIRSWKVSVFVVVYKLENGNTVPLFIAPLTKCIKNGKYELFEDIQGCDVASFIYPLTIKRSDLSEGLKFLHKTLGKKITYKRVLKTSLLYELLRENLSSIPEECIHLNISFGESIDEYTSKLSKSARQNIRTAYNRLQRDGLGVLCNVQYSNNLNDISTVEDVYYKRQFDKYKANWKFSSLRKYLSSRFKHDSISLVKSDKAICSYISVDGRIIAVMLGFINESGTRYIVPRLAIDQDYSFYSPGNILIYETIKYFITHTGIRNIDLSRGDERYKYVMGGEEYYTLSFEI